MSHLASVDALFTQAQVHHAPDHRPVPDGSPRPGQFAQPGAWRRDATTQSLIDTEALIQRWNGVDRLGYAITPRFAPSCTEAQLRGAGELAARYPTTWVQSTWPKTG